ncbi:MAG: RusA family crossover junction endodeoxyribonuclease [Nanoarchaeota archaeon]
MKPIRIECYPVTFGGPTDKDSKYYNFKEKIINSLKNKYDIIKDENIKVSIILFIFRERIKTSKDGTKSYNDLDNFLKPIIDAMHDVGIFKTEKQIHEIEIKRVLVDSRQEQAVSIKWDKVERD